MSDIYSIVRPLQGLTAEQAYLLLDTQDTLSKEIRTAKEVIAKANAEGFNNAVVLKALGIAPRCYIAEMNRWQAVKTNKPQASLYSIALYTPPSFGGDRKKFMYLAPTQDLLDTMHAGERATYVKNYTEQILEPNLERFLREADDSDCYFCHCPLGFLFCHRRLVTDELVLRGWVRLRAY